MQSKAILWVRGDNCEKLVVMMVAPKIVGAVGASRRAKRLLREGGYPTPRLVDGWRVNVTRDALGMWTVDCSRALPAT